MFRTVTPSKKGSFVPLSMTSYKIPKLQDKPIDFFPNKPSGSQVTKQSGKKLQNRQDTDKQVTITSSGRQENNRQIMKKEQTIYE